MKKGELIMELREKTDLTPSAVDRLIDALGVLFLDWIYEDDDDIFPLFLLGTFKKKRRKDGSLYIAYRPSPEARRAMQSNKVS